MQKASAPDGDTTGFILALGDDGGSGEEDWLHGGFGAAGAVAVTIATLRTTVRASGEASVRNLDHERIATADGRDTADDPAVLVHDGITAVKRSLRVERVELGEAASQACDTVA